MTSETDARKPRIFRHTETQSLGGRGKYSYTTHEHFDKFIRMMQEAEVLDSRVALIRNHTPTECLESNALIIYSDIAERASYTPLDIEGLSRSEGNSVLTDRTGNFCYDSTSQIRNTDSVRDNMYRDTHNHPVIGYFNVRTASGMHERVIITCDFTHHWCVTSENVANIIIGILKTWRPANGESSKPHKKRRFRITMGADPEFELIKRGNTISASQYFAMDGEIGTDGASSQLEIRPKPSTNPIRLVNTMGGLLERAAQKGFGIETVGDVYPLGCHIHFGGVKPEMDFILVLDEIIAKPIWHLNGKARGSYCGLSKYREQPYGFEYRSLPTGIMAKKSWAKCVFKLANVLAHMYWNGDGVPVPFPEERYKEILGNLYQYWKQMKARRAQKFNYASWQISGKYAATPKNAEYHYITFSGDAFIGRRLPTRCEMDVHVIGLSAKRGNAIFITPPLYRYSYQLRRHFEADCIYTKEYDPQAFARFDPNKRILGISASYRASHDTTMIADRVKYCVARANPPDYADVHILQRAR